MGLWINGQEVYAGVLRISNDGTKTTILGVAGDYVRIGDAVTTQRSLASEDDLLVTGFFESYNTAHFDSGVEIHDGEISIKDERSIWTGISADDFWSIEAYDTSGSARVELMRFANAAGTACKLSFFGATAVAQQSSIAAASGDDATAVNAIITALEVFGLIAAN